MGLLKAFRTWRASLGERAFAMPWFRRSFAILLAFVVGLYPIYLVWSVVTQDLDGPAFVALAWVGAFFVVTLLLIAAVVLPAIGRRPYEIVAALLPVFGLLALVPWLWRSAEIWRPKCQRRLKTDPLSPVEN